MRAAKKKSLSQTAEDFANRTSIHGISYVFDREIGFVDRILWLVVVFRQSGQSESNLTHPTFRLVVVLAFLGLATLLSSNIWAQWREEQVDILGNGYLY